MPVISLTSGVEFDVNGGTSLLNAATHAGISLPYSCKTGRCSTCKCKVLSGETRPLHPEIGLSELEIASGWILSCVRTADSDAVLEVDDLGGVSLPAVKTLPCRISELRHLAPDVIQVKLRLPPTVEFSYIPGQYIDVIGLGGVRRSYSLASAGSASKELELHIRAVEGGVLSQYWFNQAKVNDLLRLNGPLGTFFLRDTVDDDLIFLATGTGIAPVKAMLESMNEYPADRPPRSVTVLWGARVPEDLYFDVAGIPGRHMFVPVLSRAGPDWTGAHGHVQEVLLSMQHDFDKTAVYACGSDAMIHDAKELLVQQGLPSNRFYSDAFVCSSPQ